MCQVLESWWVEVQEAVEKVAILEHSAEGGCEIKGWNEEQIPHKLSFIYSY